MPIFGKARLALSAFLLSALMAAPSAWSQTRGSGSTVGTIPTNRNNPTQRPPTDSGIIFLAGKVVTDDGSALPSGVTIERVCGGSVHKEANVTAGGDFSFQMGRNATNAITPDASDTTGSLNIPGMPRSRNDPDTAFSVSGPGAAPEIERERELSLCEVRAAAAGMRSSVISLAGRHTLDNPDIGTIVLTHTERVQGTTISVTTYRAPKAARKAKESAQKLLKKGKADEAQAQLEKAVQIYPQFAEAWFELGLLHEKQKRSAEARQAFDHAIAADERYVSPYIEVAMLAGGESKWQEVADITDRALALDPLDYPVGYYYNAVANYNLKRYDAAERSALKALRFDPQHRFANLHFILARVLVRKGDLNGAAEELKSYLQYAPQATDAQEARSELTEIEQKLASSSAKVAGQPAVQPRQH